MPNQLPTIFIGSSSEGLDVAREVELQLEEHALITLWQHDVFEPGKSNLEALIKALDDFDFALMVLTPDDLLETRGESHKSPRDNVLFELGLFMGRLGRDRTLILNERDADLKLPSDLHGIGRITYRRRDNLASAVSPACTQIAKHIRKLGTITKDSSQYQKSLLIASYPRSQHPAFFSEVEDLVPQANTITLIATGLNLIWEEHIVDILINRARSGEAVVTICMANPFSPHVLDRLIEEEMRDKRAPVGRHGIVRNIKSLLQKVMAADNPETVRVCLFEHYPTFATLIFDDEVFVYPYAYQVLGTASPIFHFQNDGSDEVKFFLENAQRILRDAVPATDVLSSQSDSRYYSDSWIGAAVFAIPDSDDPFYKFGSSLIGYDIRTQRTISDSEDPHLADFRACVGEAEEYGFHVTLADALYFASEAQLDRIKAELCHLSEDFPAFELTNLQVADTLPGEQSIVILCEDASGITEAIHHELVSRMYGAAISSKYLAGRTKKRIRSANWERDSLMLQRYGSPNILNRLNLHFTLLSAPPEDVETRKKIIVELQKNLEQRMSSRPVEINELCLMVIRHGDTHWKILDSYPLRSR